MGCSSRCPKCGRIANLPEIPGGTAAVRFTCRGCGQQVKIILSQNQSAPGGRTEPASGDGGDQPATAATVPQRKSSRARAVVDRSVEPSPGHGVPPVRTAPLARESISAISTDRSTLWTAIAVASCLVFLLVLSALLMAAFWRPGREAIDNQNNVAIKHKPEPESKPNLASVTAEGDSGALRQVTEQTSQGAVLRSPGASPERAADTAGEPEVMASNPQTHETAYPTRVNQELSPEELFRKVSGAVVFVEARDRFFKVRGFGSGFFINPEGTLVTNYHVVEGAHFATIVCPDGTSFFVDSVLALEKEFDLAVLKVKGEQLPYLTLSSGDAPLPGTRVYAIGNPKGFQNTISEGLVSGIRLGLLPGTPMIQTTAPISAGSSGGPLINARGEVVGVTTLTRLDGQNLNFAVPATTVRSLLDRADASKGHSLASSGVGRLEQDVTKQLLEALAAVEEGRYADAVSIFKRIQDGLPEAAWLFVLMGFMHLQTEETKDAIMAFNAAIRLDPTNAWAHGGLGTAYRFARRLPESVKAYQKAIQLDRTIPALHCGLGFTYLMMGRDADAASAFANSIMLDPTNADAHFGLGLACVAAGRTRDAWRVYETLLLLDQRKAAELRLILQSVKTPSVDRGWRYW